MEAGESFPPRGARSAVRRAATGCCRIGKCPAATPRSATRTRSSTSSTSKAPTACSSTRRRIGSSRDDGTRSRPAIASSSTRTRWRCRSRASAPRSARRSQPDFGEARPRGPAAAYNPFDSADPFAPPPLRTPRPLGSQAPDAEADPGRRGGSARGTGSAETAGGDAAENAGAAGAERQGSRKGVADGRALSAAGRADAAPGHAASATPPPAAPPSGRSIPANYDPLRDDFDEPEPIVAPPPLNRPAEFPGSGWCVPSRRPSQGRPLLRHLRRCRAYSTVVSSRRAAYSGTGANGTESRNAASRSGRRSVGSGPGGRARRRRFGAGAGHARVRAQLRRRSSASSFPASWTSCGPVSRSRTSSGCA